MLRVITCQQTVGAVGGGHGYQDQYCHESADDLIGGERDNAERRSMTRITRAEELLRPRSERQSPIACIRFFRITPVIIK